MHAANLRDFLSDPTLDEYQRDAIQSVLDRLESDDYLTLAQPLDTDNEDWN